MSVHYKFKSALDYDTVTFDGLHISVGELKSAISQQKRIGKTSDFDLQITNAQTKEVYSDDLTLIPKNTSLLVARVPLPQQPKKQWQGDSKGSAGRQDVALGGADLSRMEGSEQDKINAMISQSTLDYDPSNYQKIRGQNQRGAVPTNYRCHRCNKPGHWIKDCPISSIAGVDAVEIRRSTGIPRSFMVPVEGPKVPGAMMTPSGEFAVPAVDHEAYQASESGEPESAPPQASEPIPDDLVCSLCRDLLTDAVMIPCCGNSFCDECIRNTLLDSEDHECPDCREKEIAPTTLIPNRFLRNSVASFRNQTGYSRRAPHRAPPAAPPPNNDHPPMMHQPLNGQPPMSHPPGEARAGDDSEGSYEDNITVTVPPPAARAPRHARPHHRDRERREHRDRRDRRDHRAPYGVHPGMHPSNMPPEMPPQMSRVMEEQRANTPTVDERGDPLPPQMMYNRGAAFPPGLPGLPVPPGVMPSHPGFVGGFPRDRPPPGYAPPPGVFHLDTRQPPPPGIKESPNIRQDEDPLEAFNRMIREKEERAKRRETERRRAPSPSPSRSRSRSGPPRYSRSRSMSRGRRRSPPPWSPRRRRSRDRSLSHSRSPSPRRRRSPPRFRSPRSPLRSPPRSPPPRSPPPRSPPHRRVVRTPPSLSPPLHNRYGGGYEDRSPPRRPADPFPARYGGRSNGPPAYPGGLKPIPSIGELPPKASPPFRPRYEDEIPPGAEPPVPGYEPPPFDNPQLPPVMDAHLPPYRPPYDAYRDLHPKDAPPFRDSYRGPVQQPPFRDVPVPAPLYRDGQPYHEPARPPHDYRDPREPEYRGPPQSFRDNPQYRNNVPYRDAPPAQYRDSYRDAPGFRGREALLPYPDGQREGFREIQPLMGDVQVARVDRGPPYRPGGRVPRSGPRRGYDERRDRDRERGEREMRDRNDREGDKPREERKREYERGDKERDDRERNTPEKKRKVSVERTPPRRRDKHRGDSHAKSRERESKRERKDERERDRSEERRSKDKERKIKDSKKKKKEKHVDKKKKKKEKKDKDESRSENDAEEKEKGAEAPVVKQEPVVKEEQVETNDKKERAPTPVEEKANLYDEAETAEIDKAIMESYVKEQEQGEENPKQNSKDIIREDSFEGLELQAPTDDPDLKVEESEKEKEMLAPLPEKSKWEMDEDQSGNDKNREPGEISPESENTGKITSDVLKRAENAIFAKKTIEIKKISMDRAKLYSNDTKKDQANIQITVPTQIEMDRKPAEINDRKVKSSKTPPKLSIKDRLGGKITEPAKGREERYVQSAVEGIKSKSKTPKREFSYRRVTVDPRPADKSSRRVIKAENPDKSAYEHSRREERRLASEAVPKNESYRERRVEPEPQKKPADKTSPRREKLKREHREKSKRKENTEEVQNDASQRERKRSTIDEANFEPDYDEHLPEVENKEAKKREATPLQETAVKKQKVEEATAPKKFGETDGSESSSDSDSSSSSSASEKKKRRKKKKKRKKKRGSDSESESDSSSDGHKKKKKKKHHKKKSSKKKKKKSKHK